MESGGRGKTEKEDGMEKGKEKETKLVSNRDGIRSTREDREEGRWNGERKRKAKLVSNEDRIKMDEGRQEGGKRE